jgi:dATP pyrophosphohydrolase
MNFRYDMIVCYVARPDVTGKDYELLQLRRAREDYMGHTWQTVRGRHEGNETAWQAALRELREETGLTPREFYKLSNMEMFYLVHDDTIWHAPSFVAVVSRDDVVKLNEEHDAFRWVPMASAEQHFMWPAEHVSLREIDREILHNGPTKPFLHLPLPE